MKSIEASVTSYLQRFWANKTISDANRILCLAIGVLTGAFIATLAGADGIYIRTLIVSSIITATAAAGYIGSYFVEGFLKSALTGIPCHIFYKEAWLKNEFKERVKLIRQLSLPAKDKHAMINAAYEVFRPRHW